MSIDRNNREYSKQEIIDLLNTTIQSEESKPVSERDIDLIEECVDYLMELEQCVDLSQEELEKEKQKIYEYNKELYKPKKNIRFKGLLVAACFAVIVLLANFTAMACGVDTIAILKEFGSRIVEMFEGEEAEYKGITVIKEGQSIKFENIDEFLNKTNLSILCPTVFPQNISIDYISVRGSYDKNFKYDPDFRTIHFITNDSNTGIIIETNPNTIRDFITRTDMTIETIDNIECYFEFVDTYVGCYFIYNDVTYFIKSSDYDDLVYIISNLKENAK